MKQVRSFYESPEAELFCVRIELNMLTSVYNDESNKLKDYSLLSSGDIEWDE